MLFHEEKKFLIWQLGIAHPFGCPSHISHDVFLVIDLYQFPDLAAFADRFIQLIGGSSAA
jgi:hypothetical protein